MTKEISFEILPENGYFPVNMTGADYKATGRNSRQVIQLKPEKEPGDLNYRSLMVAFASFWTNGTIFGLINSYGVLYVEFESRFKDRENSSSLAALIGSLCIGTTFLLSLIAGILSDHFGIRTTAMIGSLLASGGMLLSSFVIDQPSLILMTYGILVGMGASLAYTPSLVIIGHYFTRWMGFVNGFVTAGSSVFTICMPFVIDWLLKKFGLEKTLQILSAHLALLLLCTALYTTKKVKRTDPPSEVSHCCRCFPTNIINLDIWKNKRYVIWVLAIPTALFGYFVPYVHLVKYTQDILPGQDGRVLIVCIGASSGVGRIVFGLLADILKRHRILFQQMAFYCIGVLTIALIYARTFNSLIPLCLGLGLFDGCFISLLGPIAFDLVGPEGATQAIGCLLGLCSIPLTIGPPIAGWMYDYFDQSYTTAFACAGIPPIVGATLMFFINRVPQTAVSDNNEGNGSDVEERNVISSSKFSYGTVEKFVVSSYPPAARGRDS